MSWQDFSATLDPAAAGPRIAALRDLMARRGLDAVIVPRADAHQGEYVADADARLRWLTGFSGSAGFAIVTALKAGVFIDGRYRVQVRAEVDPSILTPVPWPETTASAWLKKALPQGGALGYDPWLHTRAEIEALEKGLAGSGIVLRPIANPVDAIWPDRPAPPKGAARVHDAALAGAGPAEKRAAIAAALQAAGQRTAVLTMPDSIAWLLNIRGADIPRNPIVQAFATIDAEERVGLFADPDKFDDKLRAHLGNEVTISHPAQFAPALEQLQGPVRLDADTAPEAVFRAVEEAGIAIARDRDPVALPKARKTLAEIEGMRAAHRRDAVAVIRALAWVDGREPGRFTEIDVARTLEGFRREAGAIDISFDTICGAGPNGAIVHYRVTGATNRTVENGELLLLDSGGQFPDGTTDITRTIAIGAPAEAARDAYTRVLQGMIALSRLRFPNGLSGRDIEAVARAPLWTAGMDFDHGTGHGVGAALCVHEGPLRISRRSELPLEPGMIFSNEPGYYREGEWGIRIENLIVVEPAASPDGREMLGFETLTLVPIDKRLIGIGMLSRAEIAWLDAYHARVRDEIGPLVPEDVRGWLQQATAPLQG
ncbi:MULTISPECIES: aminopeptidase P family protein [unclassified Paracoccus (in: a-proteobacteria)]|uniref:aminopeptidase P family protein n=1 Tax=unclassified Paracoccus (in: a-proteobacteria) TaxID=2688777 RepID=UPI0016025CF0|nr:MULTISPECIES: aminopeptidase P family protein [unclassified Paracoccus (in: a-proteobacteria)]MBB1491798.1 aminopeptidase P family protein [Paracoccus sp. MC1854]MBB1496893.1 aminopeptidase P family protein [Paracoccus sp. MC1862]QQO45516.1 aminopeptidase P family protein [Paracoccus sp. MC1862]